MGITVILFPIIIFSFIYGCEKEKTSEEQAEFDLRVDSTLTSLLKEVALDTTGKDSTKHFPRGNNYLNGEEIIGTKF